MPLLRRSAAPLLAALVLAACGSTVPVAVSQTGGTGGVNGPATQATAGATTPSGSSPSSSSSFAGPGIAGGQHGTTTSQAGGPAASGAVGSSAASLPPRATSVPATGPGWDARFAYVGYTNLSDFSAATKAAGTESVDPGDGRGEVAALVRYVNSHGGLLGRQLKAIEFDNKTTTAYGNTAASSQSACAAFTQDHHVLAVINFVTAYETDVFHACLAKAKVLELVGATSPATNKSLGRYAPYIYSDLVPVEDRMVPLLVDRLVARGYFTGWDTRKAAPSTTAPVKVALIYDDTALGAEIRDLYARELTRVGHKPVMYVAYDGTAASGQAAILKAEQLGVTHGITTSSLSDIITGTSAQGFFPRFAVSSELIPATVAAQSNNRKGLGGAMGIGWSPTQDLSADSTAYQPPNVRQCLQVLRSAGYSYTSGQRFAELIGLDLCDSVLLLADAIRNGGGFDRTSLHNGILRSASTFSTASTFRSGLGQGRQDIPAAAYDLAFDGGCTCFRYSGSLHAL